MTTERGATRRRRPKPAGASRLLVAGASGAATIALVAAFAEPTPDTSPAPPPDGASAPAPVGATTAVAPAPPGTGVAAPVPVPPAVAPTTAPPVTRTDAS